MIRSGKSETRSLDDNFVPPGEDFLMPVSSPSSSQAAKAPRSESTAAIPSAVIGPKIIVKGELVGEEDLLIQGQVDGTINLKGNHLTIGKQGVVKANVVAQTITIEGTVEGDVVGGDRIEILASSNVQGNLVAERVTLEDGAKFKGSIDMDGDTKKTAMRSYEPQRSNVSSVEKAAASDGSK